MLLEEGKIQEKETENLLEGFHDCFCLNGCGRKRLCLFSVSFDADCREDDASADSTGEVGETRR